MKIVCHLEGIRRTGLQLVIHTSVFHLLADWPDWQVLANGKHSQSTLKESPKSICVALVPLVQYSGPITDNLVISFLLFSHHASEVRPYTM